MKYIALGILVAVSISVTVEAMDKKDFKFDPMRISFTSNPQMKKLKLALEKGAEKSSTATAPAAPASTTSTTEATTSVSSKTDSSVVSATTETAVSPERRLRGALTSSASLWDSISQVFTNTISVFMPSTTTAESPDAPSATSEAPIALNATLPDLFTPSPSEAPVDVPVVEEPVAAVPNVAKKTIKPVKKATSFFETKLYGGNDECHIKENTYFESHTFGVNACFLSTVATEHSPAYTMMTYEEGVDAEAHELKSYATVTKIFSDEACTKEWKPEYHDGYFPIVDTLSENCDEIEQDETYHVGSYKDLSKESILWELSHAPHRETGGHALSISLFSRGRDCLAGQSDEAGLMTSLLERATWSSSKHCMLDENGWSYRLKCLMNHEVSVHFFFNDKCDGEPDHYATISREDMCKAQWSGDFATGAPVVQCGIGENWASTPEDIDEMNSLNLDKLAAKE